MRKGLKIKPAHLKESDRSKNWARAKKEALISGDRTLLVLLSQSRD